MGAEKGKLGITYKAYAVLAFIFALLGQTLLCVLLAAFALMVEKEEWLSRQCMQALLYNVIYLVITVITGLLTALLWWTIVVPIAVGIFWIVYFIFGIIGLSRVAKGNEANVMIVTKYVDKAMGRVVQQGPVYGASYAPPYAQPQQPAPPYPSPMAAPPPAPASGAPMAPPPAAPTSAAPASAAPVAPQAAPAAAPTAPAAPPLSPVAPAKEKTDAPPPVG